MNPRRMRKANLSRRDLSTPRKNWMLSRRRFVPMLPWRTLCSKIGVLLVRMQPRQWDTIPRMSRHGIDLPRPIRCSRNGRKPETPSSLAWPFLERIRIPICSNCKSSSRARFARHDKSGKRGRGPEPNGPSR